MNIPLITLAGRLERAIHADVGMEGLRTLLYGWRVKYHIIEVYTMTNRRTESGEAYLTYAETVHFSQYCGYDLTHD
jgi:hypothetical protein